MLVSMVSFLVLFSFLVISGGVLGVGDEDYLLEYAQVDANEQFSLPNWVFKCMPEKGCQRFLAPKDNSSTLGVVYDSVDLCRLTCGRFAGLWPRPTAATLSPRFVAIHPNLVRLDLIDAPPITRELLADMGKVFTNNLLLECHQNVTIMSKTPVIVYVNVKSDDMSLNWDTDESYALDMQMRGGDMQISIAAESVFGARHALETLSQLVAPTIPVDSEFRDSCGLVMLSAAKIRDKPIYPHRGLMLDTARNFIPLSDILRTIDGMAANKLNVFHWHATDSHSFPLESLRVPLLSKYGAYSPSSVYRAEDISKVISYARVRGIRVILEIDAPAHAGNGWQWGPEYGMGELAVCVNARPWAQYCVQPPCGQLNPVNENTYKILRDLYKDIAEMLPVNEVFHMGGDEVFINCWNSTPAIQDHLKKKGQSLTKDSFIRLWAEFQASVLKLWLDESGSRANVILWSSELTQPSSITKYLDKNQYVIQVWDREESNLANQLLSQGYKVIMSPKDRWYLDHGFWGTTKYSNWRRMYEYQIPESRSQNVLGGEVALWTELADSNVLDGRIWPRACSVAERLWGGNNIGSAKAAEPRLQRHRMRLIARRLRPSALSPYWCSQNDLACDQR